MATSLIASLPEGPRIVEFLDMVDRFDIIVLDGTIANIAHLFSGVCKFKSDKCVVVACISYQAGMFRTENVIFPFYEAIWIRGLSLSTNRQSVLVLLILKMMI